jgi:anti-sigma-K factor RskA
MNDHEHWEELAAGHALNALEPEEESAFARHLATCTRCQEVLADHVLVAAQLGSVLDTSDAPSWDRIRQGVVGDTRVVPIHRARSRRRQVLLSSAAAAVLVLAAVLLAVLPGSSRSTQQAALSSCAKSAGCHVIRLQDRATLVVQGGSVRVLANRLGPAPADHVYVLWQLPRDGRMTLVGALTETRDGTVGEQHRLALPYTRTAAFGLSVESSHSVPTSPTKVLAVGTA